MFFTLPFRLHLLLNILFSNCNQPLIHNSVVIFGITIVGITIRVEWG
ncbi:hypothetical protein F385_810 [Pantoea agglomerans 299R]|nr:hypothetical protein F385_810 [Pantoea agglomerans 299R]